MNLVKSRRLYQDIGQLTRGAWDRVLLDRKENGFSKCVFKIHGRLYVDRDMALSWLESHREAK